MEPGHSSWKDSQALLWGLSGAGPGRAGQELKGRNLWEQPLCLVGVLWGMVARPYPAGSQCMSGMEPVSSVTVTLPAGFLVTPLAMP